MGSQSENRMGKTETAKSYKNINTGQYWKGSTVVGRVNDSLFLEKVLV
jgi:hypothetical protein